MSASDEQDEAQQYGLWGEKIQKAPIARGNGEFFKRALDRDGLCSIASAAIICACSRESIRHYIAKAKVSHVSVDGKVRLFKIFDIARAYIENSRVWRREHPTLGAEKTFIARDPENMTPQERNAHYAAEIKRIELEDRARKLIQTDVAAAKLRELGDLLQTPLSTLADDLTSLLMQSPHGGEAKAALAKRIEEIRGLLKEASCFDKADRFPELQQCA